MLATLVTLVLSTITTPCLSLVSHGLYSLTPAPYLHKQAVSSLQSRYLTRGYSVFRDSQVGTLGKGEVQTCQCCHIISIDDSRTHAQ